MVQPSVGQQNVLHSVFSQFESFKYLNCVRKDVNISEQLLEESR